MAQYRVSVNAANGVTAVVVADSKNLKSYLTGTSISPIIISVFEPHCFCFLQDKYPPVIRSTPRSLLPFMALPRDRRWWVIQHPQGSAEEALPTGRRAIDKKRGGES